MADDLELQKAKAAAAAKAKAAAAAKAKAAAMAKEGGASASPPPPAPPAETPAAPAEAPVADTGAAPAGDDLAAAKAKAVAAAKAKAAAAAAAKAKALGQAPAGDTPSADGADGDDAKAKAIAAAKAKAAAVAAAKAKAAGGVAPATGAAGAPAEEAPVDDDRPSANRPLLELIVKKITDAAGADAIERSYINFLGKEVPTVVIRKEKLLQAVGVLYNDPELDFKYLSNLHGIDHETHMEIYYFLQSYTNRHYVALRVKTDRDAGVMPSVSNVWYGANWQEREVYDLLGVTFEGHPNMVRMFLPETWVGHPLRKDYVQFDEEV